MKIRRWTLLGIAAIVLVLGAAGLTASRGSRPQQQPQQQQPAQKRERPPEVAEFRKAMQITDPAERLKEMERVAASYPTSPYASNFRSAIQYAKMQMATSVEELVKLQQPVIEAAQGMNRILIYSEFCWNILKHQNAARFNAAQMTQAVLDYCAAGMKLAHDPEFRKSIPPEQVRFLDMNWPKLYLAQAAAYLNEGNVSKAATSLEDFKKNGGVADAVYDYVRADLDNRLGRTKEALAGYLAAAASDYGDALVKAKALYQKLNGSLDGFEARLEAIEHQLPFKPEPYKPTGRVTGKAVLAELFTGSECPPCAAVDLAFDGLLEAFDPKYLVVLEYHVPIPKPDPMMTPASVRRRVFYGVNSTPTLYFDGAAKEGGGGYRAMAEEKYKEYTAEIVKRLAETPEVMLTVRATVQGNAVTTAFTTDKVLPGAEYYLAIAQKEEKYRGENGISFHKMVVKYFAPVTPEVLKAGGSTVDLAAVESAVARFLSEFEMRNSFKFAEKFSAIDLKRLQVVFFAQDKASKRVLNAVSADVK